MTGFEAIELLVRQGVQVTFSGGYCEAKLTATVTIRFKPGEDLGPLRTRWLMCAFCSDQTKISLSIPSMERRD